MQGADISGVHVRGPGGDQGPEFINIPFGIYQSEDDEPPQGKAHFASACVYATPLAYCKVLQAVSNEEAVLLNDQHMGYTDTRPIVLQCLAHDQRLLSEDTWKLATKDAWDGTVKMPNPLWKSGRPDLTYDIGEFAPSTVKESGWSMNLLQNHVALAPVS